MLYKTAKEESKQAEEHYQIIQKECEELKKSLNEYKEEMVALKKKCEEEERKQKAEEEERKKKESQIRDIVNKGIMKSSAEDMIGKAWNASALLDRIL